jgi:hypothetical protein
MTTMKRAILGMMTNVEMVGDAEMIEAVAKLTGRESHLVVYMTDDLEKAMAGDGPETVCRTMFNVDEEPILYVFLLK